jgi:hypothetical protein
MTLCTPWIDGDDVAACCVIEDATDSSIFDVAATLASELLFEFSGRLFPGVCETTVRPCSTSCGCPWQILSRGYVIWNPQGIDPLFGGWWCNDESCGCAPLSRVLLAGQAREITEVKVNGDIVDPDTYRLDQGRWLTAVRELDTDPVHVWPGCQNQDLPDDQPGTFSVTYTYGLDVPESGRMAAEELACEIYKSCNGQKCQLPAGTTKVTRTGVTVERPLFYSWGWERGSRTRPKGWNTGMPRCDLFLNAYNPSGLLRRPVFWSPARRGRYAPTLGT